MNLSAKPRNGGCNCWISKWRIKQGLMAFTSNITSPILLTRFKSEVKCRIFKNNIPDSLLQLEEHYEIPVEEAQPEEQQQSATAEGHETEVLQQQQEKGEWKKTFYYYSKGNQTSDHL